MALGGSGLFMGLAWVAGAAAVVGAAALVAFRLLRERGAALSRGRYYARLCCAWLVMLLWLVAFDIAIELALGRTHHTLARALTYVPIGVILVVAQSTQPRGRLICSHRRYVEWWSAKSPEGAALP
jgi:hypothetical protein